MVSKHCILNICAKNIILSHDNISLNKTYGEYVSRQEHTNDDSYTLQDEDTSNKWSHIKIDPVKTEDVMQYAQQ